MCGDAETVDVDALEPNANVSHLFFGGREVECQSDDEKMLCG